MEWGYLIPAKPSTVAKVSVIQAVYVPSASSDHDARTVGSAFRPHDSKGLGDVRNKNWAKGEVMRGHIKLPGIGLSG